MRLVSCFLWIFFLGSQQVLAQPTASQAASLDDEQLSAWMTYYYLNKETSKVHAWLEWLQASQLLDKHQGAIPPVSAFISVIFSDNPNSVESWVKGIGFRGKTAETIQRALWLSGREKLIGQLFKETPEYITQKPTQLINLTLKAPADFDMMWGAFSASGNPQYVRKVIDVLDDQVVFTGDKAKDTVYRASAEGSIASNMMQHELVNRLVLKEIGSRSGVVREKLEKMVARNKEDRKPFPSQDGEFSAMLIVTDDKNLKEFDKPSNQGMRVKEVSKAKRGDTVTVKIVFAGMELTEDLMADVTFDMKVLNPDGTVYKGSDSQNLVALRTKTPLRFSVFDNQSFIKIRFEPNDKFGKYKFVALVRDNVGRKKISLSKEVELVR